MPEDDEGEWEATGPWDPSKEELADAVKAAWSLVRLQWESVAHKDEGETVDVPEAQLEIWEQYDARTLVVALTIVGGSLAMTEEITLGFPKASMSHPEAHAEIHRRLMNAHVDERPDDWA